MKPPILAITSGEPSGIGVDICLDLPQMTLPCPVVVLGDADLFHQRAQILGKTDTKINKLSRFKLPETWDTHALNLIHVPLNTPCEVGHLNPQNAPYVLSLLDTAMNGIQLGEFSGIVTAPVHKGVINNYFIHSGSLKHFSGHTEYLAEQSHTPRVVMMLAGSTMRVALLTTHLPLREVADAITPKLMTEVVTILDHDLRTKFGINSPKILLAGLNPHAGENGYLGREELDVMIPTAQILRNKGINITDPLPADTLFQPFYLNTADAVLAAYHDQGLPVLKHASFGTGVNITLGLPFIRTSVDHGTALDLAGTGRAHSGSLKTAIETAWQMAHTRGKK